MKNKLLGLALFGATATAVAFYPAPPTNGAGGTNTPPVISPIDSPQSLSQTSRPQIEVVFALDTTSSMSGFIHAAKEKIWSIASTMASAQPAPEIKIGLIAFRDRGDQYVTQVTNLSSDLDSVYAKLMDFKAAGGGDGPESVNQALYDAVHKISWSNNKDTYKVVFLVGDAPPHMDYQDEVQFPETLRVANSKGIRVNTIQSGNERVTSKTWQQIASLSQGDFFNVAEHGSGIEVTTPFDKNLATLSRELDETRLYFGDRKDKAEHRLKQAATEKLHKLASLATRARRAAFNVSDSGEENLLGKNELVEAIESGSIDLDAIEEAELPSAVQVLPRDQRKQHLLNAASTRAALKEQIKVLAEKRDDFIAKKLATTGEAEASLDNKLYSSIRRQTESKGMRYESAPKY